MTSSRRRGTASRRRRRWQASRDALPLASRIASTRADGLTRRPRGSRGPLLVGRSTAISGCSSRTDGSGSAPWRTSPSSSGHGRSHASKAGAAGRKRLRFATDARSRRSRPDVSVWTSPREEAQPLERAPRSWSLVAAAFTSGTGRRPERTSCTSCGTGATISPQRASRPFGISRDSAWSHRAWAQTLGVDVPLLSDWNGDATRAFDVSFEPLGMSDVPIAFSVPDPGRRDDRGGVDARWGAPRHRRRHRSSSTATAECHELNVRGSRP